MENGPAPLRGVRREARMSGKKEPSTLDEFGNLVVIPPPKIDLRNVAAIRREMGAVYRDMRAGKIESQDGTRLIYALTAIRQAYEAEVMESRLEALEQGIQPTGRR
jgi:hypothetical protein